MEDDPAVAKLRVEATSEHAAFV